MLGTSDNGRSPTQGLLPKPYWSPSLLPLIFGGLGRLGLLRQRLKWAGLTAGLSR